MPRCCLVVGADRLGALSRLKERFGVDRVVHWNGRFRRPPKTLPREVELVVVYTGFVSHAAMFAARKLARERGIPLIFLNRGLSELECKISNLRLGG